jgi:hypothetical protein
MPGRDSNGLADLDLLGNPKEPGGVPDWASGMLDLMAEIRVHLGRQVEQEDIKARERFMLNKVISPLDIPPGVGTATSGNLLIGSAELFGPRGGEVWDVRRVTVSGASTIATTDVTYLFKVGTPTTASAVGNNLITTFVPPATGVQPPAYQPGLGAALLVPGQSLMLCSSLNGSGSVAANEQFMVSWSGVRVQMDWLGAYLL